MPGRLVFPGFRRPFVVYRTGFILFLSSLSYAKGPETPLVKLTLSAALARTAARFPSGEALVSRHQGLRYTWREFDQAVSQVAHGLAGLGLRTRDRVGIWSTNCAEWILPRVRTSKSVARPS